MRILMMVCVELMKPIAHISIGITCCLLVPSCAPSGINNNGSLVPQIISGKILATHPTVEERDQAIKDEAHGDYYIGRRYHVNRTTFWGYLRKSGNSWDSARLVSFNESSKRSPDRLPADGPDGARHGFDTNYEYRIWGKYTGEVVYDPNSNKFLPEFKLQRYHLLDKAPGWLFSPKDRYNPNVISIFKPGL